MFFCAKTYPHQRRNCNVASVCRRKYAENEHRKDFIRNNIGLTETQARIVQMILNDTTVLSDNEVLTDERTHRRRVIERFDPQM